MVGVPALPPKGTLSSTISPLMVIGEPEETAPRLRSRPILVRTAMTACGRPAGARGRPDARVGVSGPNERHALLGRLHATERLLLLIKQARCVALYWGAAR